MAGYPEILVIRHGETEWNRLGRWQGRLDSPLTEVGEAQASAMGGLLRDMNVTPQTHDFICSPQGRAARSAELILAGAGVASPDDRLREIDVGQWTGLTRPEIRARAGLADGAHFMDVYARAPDGEAFPDVWARAEALLASLRGPSVLITHGITSRFLRTVAMGWGLDRITELPGGQGVIHRVRDGWHETLEAGEVAE